MSNLEKVALIPGADRPVGKAIAKAFGEKGIHLVIPFIEDWPDSHEDMIAEFTTDNISHVTYRCDLRNREEVHELARFIRKTFGKLDYLINNIERGGMPIVHGSYDKEVNKSQWQLEFDTTLKAKWNLYSSTKSLFNTSEGGSVTNISSIAGIVGRSGPASYLFNDGYSAANRGVSSFTETWAREAAPTIRVNEIILGLVQGRHGEQTRGWDLLTEEQQDKLLDHTLLGRTAHPEEIAKLVYFIAVEASYLTGSCILADGGYILGGDDYRDLPSGVLSEG